MFKNEGVYCIIIEYTIEQGLKTQRGFVTFAVWSHCTYKEGGKGSFLCLPWGVFSSILISWREVFITAGNECCIWRHIIPVPLLKSQTWLWAHSPGLHWGGGADLLLRVVIGLCCSQEEDTLRKPGMRKSDMFSFHCSPPFAPKKCCNWDHRRFPWDHVMITGQAVPPVLCCNWLSNVSWVSLGTRAVSAPLYPFLCSTN